MPPESDPAAARRRVERRAILLLSPATFFQGYDGLILGLALPLIRREFNLSLEAAGVATSIVAIGSFGSILLLPMADRFGRRPLLLVTILGYTAATFLTAFSTGIRDFVGYQVLARVFLGTEYGLAMIVLVELLPATRRGRALGLVTAASTFGMVAAGVGFGLVELLSGSWRVLYLVGVLPLLLVAWGRRSLPETAGWRSSGIPRGSLRGIRPRWITGALVMTFLAAVLPAAVTTFASTLILQTWNWNLGEVKPIHVVAYVLWALAVSGYFVAGRLIDRWGRKPAAAVFLVTASAGGAIAFGLGSTAAHVLGFGLVIFGLTGSAPCTAALSTEPFPAPTRGRVQGLLRVADIGGASLAPAAVGVMSASLVGGLPSALAIAGVSYALAAVAVLLLLPETRRAGPAAASV